MSNPKSACRSCHQSGLVQIVDLGSLPLANSLLADPEVNEDRFPLVLCFCPSCTLVQLSETVIPDKLFLHYLYASSFSDTMLNHVHRLVDQLVDERKLGEHSFVLEIASNDGYLLQHYQKHGIKILGVEPASNIADIAIKRGVPTMKEFFCKDLGVHLARQGETADIFHAHNVLAHVPDPNELIAGLREVLKLTGLAIIEVPYVREMIHKLEFDTIYHEHFSYFSLMALERLCQRHNLCISDIELFPIHGGSLRLFLGHEVNSVPSAKVVNLLRQEEDEGMGKIDYYIGFAKQIWTLKDELVGFLRSLKRAGHRIAAYGASAKGSTLMNVFGIGAELLDFVVDRSTLKQGNFTPGNHLPILGPEALMERRPDYVLLLTWNLAEEILSQQKPFRKAGGKFILPLPKVKVI